MRAGLTSQLLFNNQDLQVSSLCRTTSFILGSGPGRNFSQHTNEYIVTLYEVDLGDVELLDWALDDWTQKNSVQVSTVLIPLVEVKRESAGPVHM